MITEQKTYPLCPVVNGERVFMQISYEDSLKVTRGSTKVMGVFTDLKTGKQYKIKGASCGLPNCICDAVGVEV